MAAYMTIEHTPHIAPVFSGAAKAFAAWRKSKFKGKRGGGTGGKSNKFVGRCQFTDVDEDKIARLARRKPLEAAKALVAAKPVTVWMHVVTNSGQTLMMNADQFDAGGASNVASATPHFS